MRQTLFAAIGGALLVSFNTPAARAAETSPDAGDNQLEEVMVVARRQEERQQNVPITVTAISAQKITNLTVTQATDLQKLVPTLSVATTATGADESYSLRGVRTGVVTYFNEVPVPTDVVDLQLWDVDSVQALAGPQGTLFGRNSTGGAVLFVPQKPTDELSGDFESRFGNADLQEGTAVVNVPVSSSLKLRFGAQLTRRTGLVENLVGPDYETLHRNAYRVSGLFTPTDWLSNYTVVDYSTRNEAPYAPITRHFTVSQCPPGPLSCFYDINQLRALGALQEQLGIRTVSTPYAAFQRSRSVGVSNVLTADFAGVTARYIFGYRNSESIHQESVVTLALPIVLGQNNSPYSRQKTHELQFLGKTLAERLNWVAGVFSSETDNRSTAIYSLLAPATLPDYDPSMAQGSGQFGELKSLAGYAQGTLTLIEGLNLTGGLRYTKDKSDMTVTSFTNGFVCTLPNVPGVDRINCLRPLSLSQNAVTYNVSLDYHLAPNTLVYVTNRKGYNGGGFNSGIPNPALTIYQPEHITDYEIGTKSDWRVAGIPVRTNASVFYAKYKNIQRTTTVIRDGFTNTGTFNAAAATIYGAQLELEAKPLDRLTVDFSYGYLNTKYDSFDNPLLGNLAGNRFAQAPEHTLNATLSYVQPLPSGELVGTANYAYISTQTFSDANAGFPFSFQSGYGLLDLRLDWRNIGKLGIDVGIYGKNVTNQVYALNVTDQSNTFGFVSYQYGDPRTYGVDLRYHF